MDQDQQREAEDGDENAHHGCSFREPARFPVGLDQARPGRARARRPPRPASPRRSRRSEERQPALEEGGDGDLVGGVEGARVRAALLPGPAREREQRERLQVGRLELEHEALREVERGHRSRGALGIGQGEGDRDAHVRVAEVRERGAVAEADERVDDRRRLQHDLDPLVRQAEEEVRLDQLEALVGERRRVDRDLRAHAPGRMRERLLGRDVVELVARAPAERAARAGQHERVDLLRGAALEALERRRVLAVDRQQQASSPLLRREGELAGRDQALLVGERERDPVLERPERRGQAGETDDRVQHDVRLGAVEQLGQVAADLRQRREPVDRLRARGRRHQLELRLRLDDLERLAADGAGGPQEGDPRHLLEVYDRTRPADQCRARIV